MDPPFRCECVVSGTLGFVLRLSRIYGVAFLDYDQVKGGWLIRVSRSISVYGKSVSWIISLPIQLVICWNSCSVNKSDSSPRICAFSILAVMACIVTSSVLLMEACFGVSRMQYVIICLAQVEKINAELIVFGPRPSSEKNLCLLVVCTLVYGHIVNMIGCCAYMYAVITTSDDILIDILKATIFFGAVMIKVLTMQIFLIFASVFLSFNHLNCCLINLLRQINRAPKIWTTKANGVNFISSTSINTIIDSLAVNRDSKHQTSDTIAAAVRSLCRQYCRLCKVVEQLNTSHGNLLVSLTAYFFLHLVFTPYNFLTKLFNSSTVDYCGILMQFSWLLYHIVDFIMIVEACHRTNTQTDRTKHLISQLIHVTPHENQEALSELQLFYKHLMSNNVVYMPNMFFQLNRTLIVTILSSMTTYLVVLIQF